VTDAPAPVIMVFGMSKQTHLRKIKENSPQKRHNTNKPTENRAKQPEKTAKRVLYTKTTAKTRRLSRTGKVGAPAPVVWFLVRVITATPMRSSRTGD
jgi:hypothetical protein